MNGSQSDIRKALLEVLLQEDETAKRLSRGAANDLVASDDAFDRALSERPWWWFPRYVDPQVSRNGWRAFADRRSRFAGGMLRLAALTVLIALALPDQADRWMFIGFSVVIAIVWAWQADVANRELAAIAVLPERLPSP